ncbi:uncharacterized protein [Ptychodera flava]|uniref:uncharacterized protein n=1 Tax=Ptychodera flava TaxID=63121 RepID=UPI003969CBF4
MPPESLDSSSSSPNVNETETDESKSEKKSEDLKLNMDEVKSWKRFEAIQRLGARMRHRAGIVNTKERNRLQLTYRRLERAGDVFNIRVNRVQAQLKKELHDIEATRRAYESHPMSFHDERRLVERKSLERYAARGRYLFSMRAEVRKQSHAIDAYNPRLEKAKKLVEPAKKASLEAMERSQVLRVPTALNTKTAANSNTTRGKIILPPIEVSKRNTRNSSVMSNS